MGWVTTSRSRAKRADTWDGDGGVEEGQRPTGRGIAAGQGERYVREGGSRAEEASWGGVQRGGFTPPLRLILNSKRNMSGMFSLLSSVL